LPSALRKMRKLAWQAGQVICDVRTLPLGSKSWCRPLAWSRERNASFGGGSGFGKTGGLAMPSSTTFFVVGAGAGAASFLRNGLKTIEVEKNRANGFVNVLTRCIPLNSEQD